MVFKDNLKHRNEQEYVNAVHAQHKQVFDIENYSRVNCYFYTRKKAHLKVLQIT